MKHLKVFKSSLDDSNQTKLSKSKKKKLQKIRIAIDSLLERKKSLGKPELKREFQLLKTKMRNVIGKL